MEFLLNSSEANERYLRIRQSIRNKNVLTISSKLLSFSKKQEIEITLGRPFVKKNR